MPDFVPTCTSCGGDPDAVIRIQREELTKLTRRALDAEAQLALLRESNKSLEERVDWAGALRATIALQESLLEVRLLRLNKMKAVYDAAMDHYREQAKGGAQAVMFAACARAAAK